MEKKIRLYNDIDIITFNSEDDKLNIEGYAAHFGLKNLNNEYCFKESFKSFFEMYESGKMKPVLNYEHDNSKQIGSIDDVTADNTGLYVKAHINKNIPWCRDWLIPNIEMGDIKSYSTEMVVIGGKNGIRINEDGSYVVLDGLLTAVAVVQHPADWQSEFTIKNYLNSLDDESKAKEEVNKSKWYLMM